MTNNDITGNINNIIRSGKQAGVVTSKDISDVYHTFRELYKRELMLFRLVSALAPMLCFKSLHHYDEENDPMFNGDFMVGIYTPNGPISYHFKLEFLELFTHIEEIPYGPLYDNYTEEEKNERINYLTNMLLSGKSIDSILSEINNNPNLHPSCKPSAFSKKKLNLFTQE